MRTYVALSFVFADFNTTTVMINTSVYTAVHRNTSDSYACLLITTTAYVVAAVDTTE